MLRGWGCTHDESSVAASPAASTGGAQASQPYLPLGQKNEFTRIPSHPPIHLPARIEIPPEHPPL